MLSTRLLIQHPATVPSKLSAAWWAVKDGLTEAVEIADSIWHFVQSFRYLRFRVTADGTVSVAHAVSGSMVSFREDGNLDVLAARNLQQHVEGMSILNSRPEADQFTDWESYAAFLYSRGYAPFDGEDAAQLYEHFTKDKSRGL